jgi:RNA polymerase sigma-70 factor, ECF subfamily
MSCPEKGFRGTKSVTGISKREDNERDTLQDDDNSYVAQCQKGNINAFQVLVERHQKKMLNIAYRITGDYEEACETVQEAFLSAFKAIRKYRGEAAFSTWLTGITMNHARNRLKKMRSHEYKEGVSIDDPVETETGRILYNHPSQEAPIIEQLEKKELQAKVQECINSIDEEQREVVVLRDIQGYSYDEIHDILNIPEGTIKSRLFRGRETLKGCLKKVIGDL